MKVVNMHEAKTNFSKLLALVEAGDEVVIARAGKPVAKLVALEPNVSKRRIGFGKELFAELTEEQWQEVEKEYRESINRSKPWHSESF